MKIPTADGIYLDVHRESYDSIERTSSTLLRHLQHSPKHYQAALARKDADATDAQRIGAAGHVATLEPGRFRASYTVWSGGRRAGKEWEAFRAQAGALEILKEDEYQLVQAISEAALSDRVAGKYLRGGAAELTLLWTHDEPADGGIPAVQIECKARLDMVHADAIVDLKTTRDASPDAFKRQCFNLGTHIQLAMYQDAYAATHGGEILPVKIVAVENRSPFVVQVYNVADDVLELGRGTYRDLLQTLAYCRRFNKWGGFHDGELDLDLPSWAEKQSDEDVSELGLEMDAA